MLFEHAPTLPQGSDWEYDYSWSGERVLAMKDGAGVRMVSVLHRRDLTNRFPVIAAMIAKIGADAAVIDGIIRAVEPRQLAAFEATKPDAAPAAVPAIRLIGFDLLWLDNVDTRRLPLRERRQRLRSVIQGTGILDPLPPAVAVAEMLAEARRLGAEGVLARRADSRYRPFARTGDWIRVTVGTEPPGGTDTSSDPVEQSPPLDFGSSGAFGLGQIA